MANLSDDSLTKLATELAATTVRLQTIWDQACLEEWQQFAKLYKETPEAWRPLIVEPMAPSRLTHIETTVSVSVEITKSRSTGYGIALQPLNISYQAIYGASNTEASRLDFTISHTPLGPAET